MTIKEFFQGCFNMPIDDGLIDAACIIWGVDTQEPFGSIEESKRDLVLAEMLVMMSRASMGWTNKTGSSDFSMMLSGEIIPLADRVSMRNEANRIYRKHGMTENVVETNAINIY